MFARVPGRSEHKVWGVVSTFMIQSQSYVIHFPESYGKDCLAFLRKEREMGRRAKLYQK